MIIIITISISTINNSWPARGWRRSGPSGRRRRRVAPWTSSRARRDCRTRGSWPIPRNNNHNDNNSDNSIVLIMMLLLLLLTIIIMIINMLLLILIINILVVIMMMMMIIIISRTRGSWPIPRACPLASDCSLPGCGWLRLALETLKGVGGERGGWKITSCSTQHRFKHHKAPYSRTGASEARPW